MLADTGLWITVILLFLLCVWLVPIAVPLYLIAFTYRAIAAYIISRRYSKRGPSDYPCGKLLVAEDVTYYHGNMHDGLDIITGAFVMEGIPKVENVKREFTEKAVNSIGPDGKIRWPKFRMFAESWLGFYFWNFDQQFDIDDHVRLYDDENITTRLQLCSVITKLTNQPLLVHGRTRWEIILVPFKEDQKQRCLMLFRTHHSLLDGVSVIRVFMDSIMFDENGEVANKKIMVKITKHQTGQANKIPGYLKLFNIIKTVVYIPYFAFSHALNSDVEHALLGKENAKSSQTILSENISMESLKQIRQKIKCSINDIYLSCLSGAIRKYFIANKSDIPKDLSFGCPVSLESFLEPPQLRNKLSFFVVRLPIDIPDHLERLMATKKIMDGKKSLPDVIINKWWPAVIAGTFPNWLTRIMLESGTGTISLVASNIPGSEFQLQMFGLKVSDIFAIMPSVGKIGMEVLATSYFGKWHIIITMGSNVQPNQDRIDDITRFFNEEVQMLQKLCV